MIGLRKYTLFFITAAMSILSMNLLGAEVSVTINSRKITMEEAAILRVTIQDSKESEEPTIPNVAGLEFSGNERSQSTTIINGRISQSVTYTFYIIPEKAGTYTIPSFVVKADGQSYTTEPLQFSVLKGQQNSGKSDSKSTIDNYARFDIEFIGDTKDAYYVGEMIPVKLSLKFVEDIVTVTSLPVLGSEAFTITELSNKPEVNRNYSKNGNVINTFVWIAGLTPVKAGAFDVDMKSDVSMKIKTNQRRRSFWGMSSSYVTRKTKLASKAHKMTIKSLPTEGKPSNFSGAIGQFKVAASTSTDNVMVGDPITMKIIIDGRGNFERITAPALSDAEQWKAYKANSTFSPEDVIGFKGKKIFEQALIPQDERAKAIPSFNFTYFDTKKGDYVTIKTPEIPLTINRAKDEPRRYVQVDSIDDEKTADNDEEKPTVTDEDGFAPISVILGDSSSLTPVWQQKWFIVINAISIALILIGGAVYNKRVHGTVDESKKQRKKLHKQVVEAVKEVDVTLKSGDAIAFFDCCRKAIQIQIGHQLGVASETVTAAEIGKVCGSSRHKLIELFDMADAVKYSGHAMDEAQLKEWRHVLEQEMRELEV